jgi:hypothetical protein
MKCTVCNLDSPAGAAFCQHCGAKLPAFEETASPSAQTATAAASQPAGSSGVRRRGASDVSEETLWEGSFSPKAMLGTAVGCGILSIVLLVVAVVYAAGIWRWLALAAILLVWLAAGLRLAARRLGIRYRLTNQMFYHQRGVLNRVTDRIELIEIHDVTYEQSLFDRLVDVGRIKVESSDRTHSTFFLRGVENVESVAQMIDKARRGEQVRRGRRIDFSQIDGST